MLRSRFFRQDGYTLAEVMIAVGILVTVSLAGTTFIYIAAERQNSEERLSSRDYLTSELNHIIRDPRAMRVSLEKTDQLTGQTRINCVKTMAGASPLPCTAMTSPAGFTALRFENDPDPVTTANGKKCYQEKGATSATMSACDATHPIEVSVTFQIVCVGQSGAGTRATCASNQASIITQFTISPHSSLPSPRRFRTIRGTSIMEMKALYSINDLGAGTLSSFDMITKKDLTTAQRQFKKFCANAGEVMIGLRPDGEPLCKKIDNSCPSGHMFTGLRTTGSGASFNIEPVCVDISCPPDQVFVGLNPDGTRKCMQLSTEFCNPYINLGTPSGIFMVGYGPPDAKPMCRKKTCLKGEIFGGYDGDGNAICTNTAFIPMCTPGGAGGGMSCSSTAAVPTPPPTSYFVNPTNNPGLPVPYNGVPYISQWDSANGLPRQGWRNDYRDWGVNPNNLNGYYNNQRGGLFRDLIDSRGIMSGCQSDPDPGNLKVQHTWTRVHTAVGSACGSIPGAGDSCSSFGFSHHTRDRLNYWCHYRRSPTLQYHGDAQNCSCGAGPFSGWCPGTFPGSCGPQPGPCGDPDGPGPLTDPNNCGPDPNNCGANPNNCGSDPRNCACGYASDGGSVGHRCDGGEQWTSTGAHNYAVDQGAETCNVAPDHGAGLVTAQCPTGHEGYGEVDDGSDFSPGRTKFHLYYNWSIRTSCNFRYERGW